MIEWHLEVHPIKSLKPHPKNPRQLSKDQARHLRTSINKFGLSDKPTINTDLTIIGGHQRIQILKTMKKGEVECWVPDRLLDEKEVEELCIRLNKNTGSFDFDLMANNFDVPDLIDWGFKPEELEIILDSDESDSQKKDAGCKCPTCG